jgi:hypothetical protein
LSETYSFQHIPFYRVPLHKKKGKWGKEDNLRTMGTQFPLIFANRFH